MILTIIEIYIGIGFLLVLCGPAKKAIIREVQGIKKTTTASKYIALLFGLIITTAFIALWPFLLPGVIADNRANSYKKKTLLDEVSDVLYGENAQKSANLDDAIKIAYEEILLKIVPENEVSSLAKALYDGPMAYSTDDLAFAVALNFFKNQMYTEKLRGTTIKTSAMLKNAIKRGSINPIFADSFDSVMKRLYSK